MTRLLQESGPTTCLRFLDCSRGLRCCQLPNEPNNYCSTDCTKRLFGQQCSESNQCNSADSLKCCNGSCVMSSSECPNLNRGLNEPCSLSSTHVTWNVCNSEFKCRNGKCSHLTNQELAERYKQEEALRNQQRNQNITGGGSGGNSTEKIVEPQKLNNMGSGDTATEIGAPSSETLIFGFPIWQAALIGAGALCFLIFCLCCCIY